MYDPVSRREFLRQAMAAGVATTVAAAVPRLSSAARPRSPNERLNIGVVGVANQGGYNLHNVASQNIVALCDIDAQYLDSAAKEFPSAKTYRDYRRMFDEQKNLDAVVVAT